MRALVVLPDGAAAGRRRRTRCCSRSSATTASSAGSIYDLFDFQFTFSKWGVILAETFVAMPFLVITVEAGLRSIDRRYEDAAASLGAGRWTVFRRVTVPMIAPALIAGAALAWARALGEFGATITFAGNIQGRTQTTPLAVYNLLETNAPVAITLSLVLLAISIVILVSLRDHWFGGIRVTGSGRDAARRRRRAARSVRPLGRARRGRRRDRRRARTERRGEVDAAARARGPGGARARVRSRIDDAVMDDPAAGTFVVPERRGVGVVFQDYLLFPHLTVLENVAFGLRSRGVARAEARRRAQAWLARVGLADRAGAKPGSLSGGQQQRVALARALVTEPRLVLLDEPLAALDVGTRTELRRDLRTHLATFGGARVLVTHELLDAVALADRLVVLEDGRVAQSGAVHEVTTRPRSRYVADLVGVNLLRGVAQGHEITLDGGGVVITADPVAGDVYVAIQPHSVSLHRAQPEGSPRNVWSGRVRGVDLLGDRVRIHVDGAVPIVAEVTAGAVGDLGLHDGVDVWATVKATDVSVYAI